MSVKGAPGDHLSFSISIKPRLSCLNKLYQSVWQKKKGKSDSANDGRFFVLRDLEIWWLTLTNISAPLLFYIKFCAAFESHWYIQTGVTVRKPSIRVKIGDFLSRESLKIDGWPWKTIGHLFYTALSFVQHFKAIGIFKLELQSGNDQFGSKLAIFCPAWHWNLMDYLEKQ